MRSFRLTVILVFILVLQVNVYCRQWVRVQLDSIASINFPAQPRQAYENGNKIRILSDATGLYVMMASETGVIINDTLNRLDVIYDGFIRGIRLQKYVGDLSVKDIQLNGLPGKEVDYTFSQPDSIPILTRSKALIADGNLYWCAHSSYRTHSLFSENSTLFLESFGLDANKPLWQFDGGRVNALEKMNRFSGLKPYAWICLIILLAAYGAYVYYVARRKRMARNKQ